MIRGHTIHSCVHIQLASFILHVPSKKKRLTCFVKQKMILRKLKSFEKMLHTRINKRGCKKIYEMNVNVFVLLKLKLCVIKSELRKKQKKKNAVPLTELLTFE